MPVFWELRDRYSLPENPVPQNREICAHLRWTVIRPYTCIFELCCLRLWWQWHWIYHIIQLNGWIGWESGLLCEISDWVKVCDVGFYWIHPGLDSKEVARPRLDSVHQEESNRCFAGKWGESRGLPTGETEEGRRGNAREAGTLLRPEWRCMQGRICSLDLSVKYIFDALLIFQHIQRSRTDKEQINLKSIKRCNH